MSIYDREIIYLSWTRKNKNGEKNKKKEAENEVGYKLKIFFKNAFQYITERKTLEANTEGKKAYEQSVAHYTLLCKIVCSARL